jgi:hypothetical protein
MAKWRSIKTAPKDGTQVMVVFGIRPDIALARYSKRFGRFQEPPPTDLESWLKDDGCWLHAPILWQPIPPLPKDLNLVKVEADAMAPFRKPTRKSRMI